MTDSSPLGRPMLVLIVNDHEWSVRSLESILAPNRYATLRAFTGVQAMELARHAQPDVIVIERRLGDMDAIEVCRQLRDGHVIGRATPIIVTSDTTAGRAERLELLRAGAWDVFVHPIDAEILLAKLQSYAQVCSELRRLEEASLLDDETGLYNARGLTRRAREIGAEAIRRRGALACVVFSAESVDGSAASTAELARRLGEQLVLVFERTGRLSDVVGRLGQSEYAVIAPATEAQGAARLVERIEAALTASQADAAGAGIMPGFRLRVGYAAVADLAESTLDPVELLLRASASLRDSRPSGPTAARTSAAFGVAAPGGLLH